MPHNTLNAISWAGDDVWVCRVGGRTPIGLTANTTAAAVRAGISGITVHPDFLDKVDEPMAFATDALLDPRLPIPERMAHMLASVLEETTSGFSLGRHEGRLGCWLALPEPRVGIVVQDIGRACNEVFKNAGLPDAQVLPRGHAAGLMALQVAARAIAAGDVDLAWVAAVDSYQDEQTLKMLDEKGWLMSAIHRNGFPPGEAAGACVLANSNTARRLGLTMMGAVGAASTAMEPIPIGNTQDVCLGEGLTAALKAVISTLRLPEQKITATYCDLNGQRYRSEEFVYALLRTQEAFVNAHGYMGPADCWGDVGAACGTLFVALALTAHERGYSQGPRPLLWAASESGYRTAILLNLPSH